MANNPQTKPTGAADHMALERFNLATMSGVFPGTRTQVYQRLHLIGDAEQRAWLQLLWYDAPASCVGYLITAAGQAATPLVELTEPQGVTFLERLQEALAAQGWALYACGTCHFWQRTPTVNGDGLPLGTCRWQSAQSRSTPPAQLANQSGLALACAQWQPVKRTAQAEIKADSTRPVAGGLAPMRRAAESAAIRLSVWQRIVRHWQRRAQPPTRTPEAWAAQLVERSGVGAGTESCFVCQGRIANLGALTVASAEGDKETYSIWRCRACYTLYLNDWVDRWERLDNLETEERYYRVAPAEGITLLGIIEAVQGGEHPNRRHERQAQRQIFIEFMADHPLLSHQIRQGR